jgi:hypothetical protein
VDLRATHYLQVIRGSAEPQTVRGFSLTVMQALDWVIDDEDIDATRLTIGSRDSIFREGGTMSRKHRAAEKAMEAMREEVEVISD